MLYWLFQRDRNRLRCMRQRGHNILYWMCRILELLSVRVCELGLNGLRFQLDRNELR